MQQRRPYSANKGSPNGNGTSHDHKDTHEHEHEHEHEHDHSHSHSIFSLHSHSHGEGGQGAEKIIEALQGSGDRGSQITLVGLFANIGLTAAKGAAGWYMHSASLLADAGHSLSDADLLGDFVTLFCWRLSRKPPSEQYPYGFAKFETLGTTAVSLLLIGGALGIGVHSYHLLIVALSEAASHTASGSVQTILQHVASVAPHIPTVGHAHVHTVDPNAAWFAAVSVLAKEWLYRITKKVADEEKSPVLQANAIHHRSDAFSSVVALVAILGSWLIPALPLDPIGGLIVAIVILRQGLGLLGGAWRDLTDASVSSRTRRSLLKTLDPLISTDNSTASDPLLLAIRQIRARRSGSLIFVDLKVDVPGGLTVYESASLEMKISQTLMKARKEIAEVNIQFRPIDVKAQA
ncbi:mitochondrial iron ion transporter [Pleurotus eryngii]|uniref:Mitochondrial iron ion transporter n=1 Tax=Pleurotus eryngii TaxID=5323 RepID=A0A9P6AAT1_PLEER|nr:mitochondrial iron ion transporter [Pleurotus eryngii]